MKHETQLMRDWLRYDLQGIMFEDLTVRDRMRLASKFDFYIFPGNSITCPGDAKKQTGGKNFSLKAWRKGSRAHQLTWLCRFKRQGYMPIVPIFWHKKKYGKWITRVLFIEEHHEFDIDYELLEDMPIVDSAEKLREAIREHL